MVKDDELNIYLEAHTDSRICFGITCRNNLNTIIHIPEWQIKSSLKGNSDPVTYGIRIENTIKESFNQVKKKTL